MQTRCSPPGEPAARAGRPPHTVGRRMQARYSPPGAAAARAGRPPHMVGRRNANSILPTRRARCAGWPTSPQGGEAKCKLDTPHPGEPAARAGRPPHTVGRRNANSILPTRRARCAGWPTSPHGGEAKCKLDTPHPASPLRGLADLPTRWGGEMQARCSPPGEPAARAGRPPHMVGRRNANSILPTRRARCAGWPTSPHGGEAKCKLDTPHPASPLRELADLPTRWGGEMQARPPCGEAKCKLDTPHPASPLRGLADLPTRCGGEMQARYSPPGEPASRAGRPPHTVRRQNANSMLPTRRACCAGWPTSPHGGEAKCKLDTPHPASPLRGLADLPTRWGGEKANQGHPC